MLGAFGRLSSQILSVVKKHRLLSIAFVIAIGISFSVVLNIYPYRINLVEKRTKPSPVGIMYHDFQNDGYSELLMIWNNIDSSYTGLVFYNLSNVVLRQINLKGKFFIENKVRNKWIHITDYDGDGIDETFLFHVWKDTLFLALIEFKNKPYLEWDIPIIVRGFSNQSWDVAINDIQWVQLAPNEPPFLIFALFSGVTLFPRGLYAVDVWKKQIKYKYETRVDILKFVVCNIDSTPEKEILLKTYTSNNYSDLKHQDVNFGDETIDDQASWFIILNYQLKPRFKPRRVLPPYSALTPFCLPMKDTILTVTSYDGTEAYAPQFIWWSANGDIIRRKPLFYSNKINIYPFLLSENRIYIYNFENSKLTAYNKNLSHINTLSISGILMDMFMLHENKIGIVTSEHFYVASMNLDVLGKYNFPQPLKYFRPFASPYVKKGLKGKHWVLSDGKDSYRFQIVKNIYYQYRAAIFFGAFIFTWGIVAVILWGFIALYVIGAYFYVSLNVNPNITFIVSQTGRFWYGKKRILTFLGINDGKFFSAISDIVQFHPQFSTVLLQMIENGEDSERKIPLIIGENEKYITIKLVPLKALNITVAFYGEIQSKESAIVSEQLEIWIGAIERTAHDLRSLMNGLTNGLTSVERFLNMHEELPESIKKDILEAIENEKLGIKKAFLKVRQLLKITRISQMNFKKGDVHHTIERSIQNFKEYFKDGDIQLTKEFDPDVPEMCFDSDQLEAVWNILIENAIDAMEGKGSLMITTSIIEKIENPLHKWLEISITDTGGGIPEHIRPYIFIKKVPSSKMKGSGIGLLLARQIVEAHQGKISYNIVNNGTNFVVLLPVVQECKSKDNLKHEETKNISSR